MATLDSLFGTINVQRGSKSIGNGSSSATETITSVDMNKSFVIVNSLASGTSTSVVAVELTNATTLTFSRNSTSGTSIAKWQVVTVD
tara:strand:+ start:1220 stop:1480 length:261 start_codon:yes stop_codon:yes gene_type:complete